MMYQYFVKIVPTIYVKTDGEVSPKVCLITFGRQHSALIPNLQVNRVMVKSSSSAL